MKFTYKRINRQVLRRRPVKVEVQARSSNNTIKMMQKLQKEINAKRVG